jgi:hypothetical protein
MLTAALFAAFLSAAGTAIAAGSPAASARYFSPSMAAGSRLDTVFSKTVAITGAGFEPLVRRISGSGSDRIRAIDADTVTDDERYEYDGRYAGSDVLVIRDRGSTYCDVHGKCARNDETSAPIFNSLLWGRVPAELAVGSSWKARIDAPWEIGPPGTEEITVLRLDPARGLITLVRRGNGAGLSSDDIRRRAFTIVSHGRSIKVKLSPGPATWNGRATFLRGVTVADEIMLIRPVELVSDSGEKFSAEERIYTIFVEA